MCCKRSNLKFDVMQSVSFAAIWPCRSMLDLLCGLFAAFSVACMSFQITACCCHLTGPHAHNTHQMSPHYQGWAIIRNRPYSKAEISRHQRHQQRVIIAQDIPEITMYVNQVWFFIGLLSMLNNNNIYNLWLICDIIM